MAVSEDNIFGEIGAISISKSSTNASYHNPHTVFNGKSMYVGGDVLLRLFPLAF